MFGTKMPKKQTEFFIIQDNINGASKQIIYNLFVRVLFFQNQSKFFF